VEAALERVPDGAVVGLDATPLGQPVYERLGFRETGTVLRMEVLDRPIGIASSPDVSVLPEDLPDGLLRLDAEAFGADRAAALRSLRQRGKGWLAGPPSQPTGYAFLREGEHALHVGPVVAENVATADLLVRAALADAAPGPLLIDAPVRDGEWLDTLRGRGFAESRRLARMYRAPAGPPGRPDAVRALFGPEFG